MKLGADDGNLKCFPLFILGAVLESATQLCLKKGALKHQDVHGLQYLLNVVRNKWVITGVLIYLLEMVLWIVLLMYIPLTIAFPLTGIQKVMIILFAAFVLKEGVSKIEWAGVFFIALGISFIVRT